MEKSPKEGQGRANPQSNLLPAPPSNSSSSGSSNSNNNNNSSSILSDGVFNYSNPSTPKTQTQPIARSEPNNPYPTTYVQADTSSFKQVVQMLTGTSETAKLASQSKHSTPRSPSSADPCPASTQQLPKNPIPPIRPVSKSKPSKLYERRNSLKALRISPLIPGSSPNLSGLSPRNHPEILSPSLLDFPALVLSPVTPLIPDPFNRSPPGPSWGAPETRSGNSNGNGSNVVVDRSAEEKAIAEKGFYLHRSPVSTPRGSEPPRLLPLFPVTSPRVSGSD